MKKATKPLPKLNEEAIRNEFDALCKKHKLESAILVIEHNSKKISKTETESSVMVGVHSKNKKKESALLELVRNIFSLTGLNLNAMKITSDFITAEHKRQKLYQKEQSLSKENKLKLLSIRSKKAECVINKQYEEASKWREKELKILGIKPVEVSTSSNLDELINYKPSPDDLKKMTDDLISKLQGFGLKGWTVNK